MVSDAGADTGLLPRDHSCQGADILDGNGSVLFTCQAGRACAEPAPGYAFCGDMTLIPPGTTFRGASNFGSSAETDERPTARISTGAFFLDNYEVTASEYLSCLNSGACSGDDISTGDGCAIASTDGGFAIADSYSGNLPMNCVGHDGALDYCEFQSMSLPTENQWVMAARGPCRTESCDDERSQSIWLFSGNTFDAGRVIGGGASGPEDGRSSCLGNPQAFLSVCHLAGNVAEVLSDTYNACYYDNQSISNTDSRNSIACDGSCDDCLGFETATSYSVRGGSYASSQDDLRIANRDAFEELDGSFPPTQGFRCAVRAGVIPGSAN